MAKFPSQNKLILPRRKKPLVFMMVKKKVYQEGSKMSKTYRNINNLKENGIFNAEKTLDQTKVNK